jgi:hypothetical protein
LVYKRTSFSPDREGGEVGAFKCLVDWQCFLQ